MEWWPARQAVAGGVGSTRGGGGEARGRANRGERRTRGPDRRATCRPTHSRSGSHPPRAAPTEPPAVRIAASHQRRAVRAATRAHGSLCGVRRGFAVGSGLLPGLRRSVRGWAALPSDGRRIVSCSVRPVPGDADAGRTLLPELRRCRRANARARPARVRIGRLPRMRGATIAVDSLLPEVRSADGSGVGDRYPCFLHSMWRLEPIRSPVLPRLWRTAWHGGERPGPKWRGRDDEG